MDARIDPDLGVPVVRSRQARSRLSNRVAKLMDVDGRSAVARRFRDLTADVIQDQGGVDRCSTVRLALIRRFAGLATLAETLEARLVAGHKVDVVEATQLASTLVRLASRIGLDRRAKSVPDLDSYLAQSRRRTRRSHNGNDDDAIDGEVLDAEE